MQHLGQGTNTNLKGTKMTQAQIEVILHADEEQGGYWAEVPYLGGCVSEGDTLDETLENISEAASGVIECMLERVAQGRAPGFPSLPERSVFDAAKQGEKYAQAVIANFLVINDLFMSERKTKPASEVGEGSEMALYHTLGLKTLRKGGGFD